MSERYDQHSRHWMGMQIRERRIAAGLTQRQLADEAGISLGALRDLEQGRTHSPVWAARRELRAILGLDQSESARFLGPRTRDIRIEVLGPLTASRQGAPVPLGSARQRAVFALLVLHRGTILHRDAFIDVLWGMRPPASAVTELQGYVSRLRKLLGSGLDAGKAGNPITTVGAGYRLMVDDGQLDAATFEDLVGLARRAVGSQNPARACSLYERALSLWHGEVLADIDLLRQHPAVIALACRRSDAVLLYGFAAELAGVHEQVLPHLRDLCARERFNERAHAHMMIALAATGQQAAALHTFTELRSRLNDELGIRPSALLAEAHTRVLRQQTAGRYSAAVRETDAT